MTLVNGLVEPGSTAWLWTDTAWWNGETGEVIAHATKAFVGQFWPFVGVLSVYGGEMFSIVEEMADDIGNPGDVATLLTATASALRGHCARGGIGRVLLATNLDGPRLFSIASDGAGIAEPFEPAELLSFVSSGTGTPAYRAAIARGFTPKRMRRVIDAQLAEPFDGEGPLAALGRASWIGGQIVEIEVAREGAECRVLRAVGTAATWRTEGSLP